MQFRCRTAEVLGTSTLYGYRLVFNGVATIEPDPDSSVPVLLWDIKPTDEIPLDRYEGYPQRYRRETVQVELNGKTVDAIYCHWDGYPEHQMPILTGHYDTAEKVRALLALGDISSLGERIVPMPMSPAVTHKSIVSLMSDYWGIPYYYLFDEKKGSWISLTEG